MTGTTLTPGVVARWTVRRPPAAGTRCTECSTPLTGVACGACGQLAGETVGMIATVVASSGRYELVIAERSPDGDWLPVRRQPATPEVVRALSRPCATGPQVGDSAVGGLW